MSTARLNKTRTQPVKYDQGNVVYVSNKQIKSKDKQRYKPEEVEGDGRVTIKTKSGKLIHKSHLRN